MGLLTCIAVLCVVIVAVVVAIVVFVPDLVKNTFDADSFPFNMLAMRPAEHRLLTDMMMRLDVFCRENNVEYFVHYGSLLGIVRYANRLPWDDDIDIGVVGEFPTDGLAEFGLAVTRENFGWKIHDAHTHRRANREPYFPFIDIFRMERHGDSIRLATAATRKQFPRGSVLPYADVFPTVERVYDGVAVQCPRDTHAVLDALFTPGWRDTAKIMGTHSGLFFVPKIVMRINEKTTNDVTTYYESIRKDGL